MSNSVATNYFIHPPAKVIIGYAGWGGSRFKHGSNIPTCRYTPTLDRDYRDRVKIREAISRFGVRAGLSLDRLYFNLRHRCYPDCFSFMLSGAFIDLKVDIAFERRVPHSEPW